MCRVGDGSVLLASSLDGHIGYIDINRFLSSRSLRPLTADEEASLINETYGAYQNDANVDIVESPMQLILEKVYCSYRRYLSIDQLETEGKGKIFSRAEKRESITKECKTSEFRV
jgi:hypothetical protein